MQSQQAEKAYYSLRELARRLGVSYRHLHRATKDGRVRVIRLGGAIRVSQQEANRIFDRGF